MKRFEEITIFQTRFHKLTVNQLIQYLVDSSREPRKKVVGHANIRAMNFAYELPWYRDFLNNADLVFCDGFGILLGAKLFGYSVKSTHRMTCPDYIENLARACEKNDMSLFLLAGSPGVVDKAIAKLTTIAPKLKIDGHHGFFNKSGVENEAVIQKINKFKPAILYIGFGMPLQERWILENSHQIDARVFLPLGACLDFYTNSVYRGPRWLTDSGFEWMTRLATQPKTLWKRYILGNSLFFYRIYRQKFLSLLRRNPTSA